MSHFYRLYTINNASQNAKLAWDNYKRASGIVGKDYDFERGFEEIPLDPPWPYCKMYRAPLITDEYNICTHIFKYTGKIELPEIWGGGTELLISERVKDLILNFDDFGHQVCATTLVDRKKEPITSTPYYQLNIRRFVEIESLGGKIENEYEMFRADFLEKQYLPTVQQTPELLDKLAALPLWRHRRNNSFVYLSEAMLQHLKQAGVTGLTPYRGFDGKPLEALARFM